MSKGNSGLFHNTLGTTHINGSEKSVSYSERGIELPANIKKALSKLKEKGDVITGSKDSFLMRDVSIMSRETGVEFAHVTIGDKAYLVRGDEKGVTFPAFLERKMKEQGGILDFHSHPFDDDCIPSKADTVLVGDLKRITGQSSSKIVTPNGKTVVFNELGVITTGTVPNTIDENLKAAFLELWR